MYEMTMSGILRFVDSVYVKDYAEWMILSVKVGDNEPEFIINPKSNFNEKLHYIKAVYGEDLVMKSNPDIKITGYDFVESLSDFFIGA